MAITCSSTCQIGSTASSEKDAIKEIERARTAQNLQGLF